MINTPSQSPQQPLLPPLPQLTVVRDKYCSQQMTDDAIRFLQERRSDLIQSIAQEEHRRVAGNHGYNKCIGRVLEFLKGETSEVTVPATRLGRLDLMFELGRRIVAALKMPPLQMSGNPLAASPDDPLPPLAAATYTRVGLTQDLADKTMRVTYERRPDIFYEIAEQLRRDLVLNEIDAQFNAFRHQVLDNEFGVPDDPLVKAALLGELYLRIRLMIGLPFPEHLKQS